MLCHHLRSSSAMLKGRPDIKIVGHRFAERGLNVVYENKASNVLIRRLKVSLYDEGSMQIVRTEKKRLARRLIRFQHDHVVMTFDLQPPH